MTCIVTGGRAHQLFQLALNIGRVSSCVHCRPSYQVQFRSRMAAAGGAAGDAAGAHSKDTFLYFGYGSNLSTDRIHIQNPSAVKKDIGKLKDYKLTFNYRSQRWQGAVATIEQSVGEHVWGVVWELDAQHLASLDDQEGVHQGVYNPIEVTVETPDKETLTCRSYQLLIYDNQDKRPSTRYKGVILKGANENGLPQDYIDKLNAIEDNGYNGEIDMLHPDPPMKD